MNQQYLVKTRTVTIATLLLVLKTIDQHLITMQLRNAVVILMSIKGDKREH